MNNKYYTAGEFAKLSGVSARTIRFYDEKGLLKPVDYSESEYRYYDENSFSRLQKILMFKYLGFSLEQIEELVTKEFNDREAMKQSLAKQRFMLIEKQKEISRLLEAVDIAETCNEEEDWNTLLGILNLFNEKEEMDKQYEDDVNLNRRISIHSYSTSPINWMDFVYERLRLEEGMKVLEIGCGNSLLWNCTIHRLPKNITLVLTDNSQGMLDSSKQVFLTHKPELKEKNITVSYHQVDANHIDLDDYEFDVIIANHMLYHVEDKESCLREIQKRLKPSGHFYCSTLGSGNMKEIHELLHQYDDSIETPLRKAVETFSLENGKDILQKYFRTIDRRNHDCDLIVDNAQVIWDYAYSFPGNVPLKLDRTGNRFMKLLQDKIEKDGAIFIHKEVGIFECQC